MANTKLINCDQLQTSLQKVKDYVDGKFAVADHNHNNAYYTQAQINTKINDINSAIGGKANATHSHKSSDVTTMGGYSKPDSTGAIATTDSLNAAIGKLETALDGKSSSSHNHSGVYLPINGTAASATKLATARTINGVAFDGTKAITITANPNAHNQASNTINAMTGYAIAKASAAIATTDSLNTAIGKLEYAIGQKQASGSYAAANHTHDDRYYTETEINTKISDLQTADTENLTNAKAYTDTAISKITGKGVSEALDTLKELGDALNNDANFASTMTTALAGKADSNHIHDVATTTTNGFMSSDMVTKLNGIANNANNYVHPTTAGNKHIPAGGTAGQFLGYSATGTAQWVANPNTDSKVNTAADTTSTKLYLTGATGATTAGLKYSSSIFFSAKDGTITASGFNGKATSAGSADTASACSGNAASASKVNSSLTIQFNGVNNKTFNGSSAQTVNITPASIGAATTADTAKATDTEVSDMLTTIFG